MKTGSILALNVVLSLVACHPNPPPEASPTTKMGVIQGTAVDHWQTPVPPLDRIPEGVAPIEGMVYVPAGKFWRGCIHTNVSDCREEEWPGSEIELDAFWIDDSEVSAKDFLECIRAGLCEVSSKFVRTERCNLGPTFRLDHPINCVDQAQAKQYCDAVGKVLPTEAQWEKAARGIDRRYYSTVDGRRPICNEVHIMNHDLGCGTGLTSPVKSHPVDISPYGAMDMAGNVSEIVQDTYHHDAYLRAAGPNPVMIAPAPDGFIVTRGASVFSRGLVLLTTFSRQFQFDSSQTFYTGFRCAYSGEQPPTNRLGAIRARTEKARQLAALPQSELQKHLDESIEWVNIPGGDLEELSIPTFEMMRDEITVAQYQHCSRLGHCKALELEEDCNWGRYAKFEHPINCITGEEALAFCKSMDARLPTSDEWYWAARGREEAREYPWGDEIPGCEHAISGIDRKLGDGCGRGGTAPVGSVSPRGDSRDGVRDLAGNIAEFTSSSYPENPEVGVAMGGNWTVFYEQGFTAEAITAVMFQDERKATIGARCVRDVAR